MNVALLVAQTVATWYMVGVIWMVQLIHYPLMAKVGREQFVEYERLHTTGMGFVVIPGMMVELVTSVVWVRTATERDAIWAWCGLGLVAVIWLSTFLVQVPLHEQLSQAFDAAAHRRLVGTNWVRTVAWTARGVMMAYMLTRLPNGSR